MTARVLSIAGTDPTGGAGIQADLKSIGALGGYGMAVVTALVAQNTHGVRSVHMPPVAFLREQLDAVSDDVTIDAVKIGMLGTAEIVATVSDWLDAVQPPLVVLDPVMIATSGDRLLDAEAEQAVRALCRRADLVTPNLDELAVLVGEDRAESWTDAVVQATTLASSCGAAVLLKGGHLDGAACPDAIVTAERVDTVPGVRVETRNSHGTGCSLSSAMATLGPGADGWVGSLRTAKEWLTGALRAADALQVGTGNGPIDHFHALRAPDFTAEVWAESAELRAEIDGLDFVRRLGDGTLERADFEWYLAQDALYLVEYSRVLARASQLAPTAEEQVFWAESAGSAIAAEAQLHRERLGPVEDAEPGATTLAYVNHLHACATLGGYGELVAALLPCFWIYADVGQRLAAASHAAHPYADWLTSYGDPAFAAATERAIAITAAAARAASPGERSRMRTAFLRSTRYEYDFFAAPLA